MRYYTIQVMTGEEDDFLRRLKVASVDQSRFILPKKLVPLHRHGIVIRKVSRPIFPGYIFLRSENLLEELNLYWTIRQTDGFVRYLRENPSPSPLSEQDLQLIRHFISFGECADTSKVIFDANDRIVVLQGPLAGLEGKIVKVDKRKGRAKVVLDFYENAFPIDLGFEVVERVSSGGSKVHEESRS